MQPTSRFSLTPPTQATREDVPRCELRIDGAPTGRFLAGQLLEQQFEVGTRYLLLVTEDSPFEELLHLYLLDADLSLLDERELGQPYTPGVLQDVAPVSRDQLQFSFFGGDLWRLTVLERPRRLWRDWTQAQPRRRLSRLLAPRYLLLEPCT